MQLKFSFATLLAGVLLALTAQDAEARPMKRNVGMVTLPLKRVEQRTDVHPLVHLQQHINRSNRRLARMTGREAPSDLELRQHIERRVLAVEEAALKKRFNRNGIVKVPRGNRLGLAAAHHTRGEAVSFKKGRKGKGTAATAAASSTSANSGSNNSSTGAGVEFADAPTASNSLGLDIEGDDVGYLATIQMGTPPRDFLILMDSGSADLWVGSEECQSESGGGCGNHNFLGSQSSSSFQASNKQFQVTYGTGNVAGTIIQDNIAVAGLALNAHSFGVATQESVDFADDSVPFDGLMGLAQSTLSEQGVPTPPESLASAGLISDAITSFKISREADNKNDGEITFGGLDDTKFDSATLTTFDNVNTQGFWEGAMDSVSVDGTDAGLSGRTAILDTGTTLIVAPEADAEAVHKLIDGAQSDGQGGFTVPCTTNASVALTFSGTTFAIDPRDIAFQPVNANDPTGDCISGISSGNIGGATEWLVGDVFLKNAYFSVDVGKNQISLAKLV